MSNEALPLAHNIDGAVQRVGIGRSKLYEEIRTGRLRTVKVGKRTLILEKDIERWLDALPSGAS